MEGYQPAAYGMIEHPLDGAGKIVNERRPLQLEEGVGNLQHQDMRMIVLVANQNPLTRPPHPMLLIVLFQPLQSREDGGIFFRLVLFGAEGVVAERKEANGLGLICREGLGEYGPEVDELHVGCKVFMAVDLRVGGLESCRCDRGHLVRYMVLLLDRHPVALRKGGYWRTEYG